MLESTRGTRKRPRASTRDRKPNGCIRNHDDRGRPVVTSILPFLKGTGFSPEITLIMGEAFDRAMRDLDDIGQPAVVQEILAKRIIDIAAWGELNPEILSSKALESLGIQPD